MHQNEKLIDKFYNGFKNLDVDQMKSCYHSDVHFSDPVFPSLRGKEVPAMWSMLIDNLNKGRNPWRLVYTGIAADDVNGVCRWEAHYTLSATGRKVHNIIDAKFEFKDGLIIRHVDRFDFYRWSRLGFGAMGTLIGWTPFFKNKVRKKVTNQLEKYLMKER